MKPWIPNKKKYDQGTPNNKFNQGSPKKFDQGSDMIHKKPINGSGGNKKILSPISDSPLSEGDLKWCQEMDKCSPAEIDKLNPSLKALYRLYQFDKAIKEVSTVLNNDNSGRKDSTNNNNKKQNRFSISMNIENKIENSTILFAPAVCFAVFDDEFKKTYYDFKIKGRFHRQGKCNFKFDIEENEFYAIAIIVHFPDNNKQTFYYWTDNKFKTYKMYWLPKWVMEKMEKKTCTTYEKRLWITATKSESESNSMNIVIQPFITFRESTTEPSRPVINSSDFNNFIKNTSEENATEASEDEQENATEESEDEVFEHDSV